MDLRPIGENIRKFRRMQKMSQADLAEKAGLSTNYIGSLERGEKVPALDTLIIIMNSLGVSADMILCDVVDIGYEMKASALSDKMQKIDPEERRKILEVLEVLIRHTEMKQPTP